MRQTTVLLPDELHKRLRQEAVRSRTSMAGLIRARLGASPSKKTRHSLKQDPLLALAGICHGEGSLASQDIDKDLYGI
jgi:hypothetical protein